MGKTMIGLDLAVEYSQLSYFNERSLAVETVSIQKGKENYLIPTPKDLFKTALEAKELGIITLSNFIKACLSYVKPLPDVNSICMLITMREVTKQWITALKEACEMVGIPAEQVFFQSYKESFQCYVLNEKKDIWAQSILLFEYEKDRILSSIMRINRSTRPALITVEEKKTQKMGSQGSLSDADWNSKRDQLFLEQIQNVFQGEKISSCFLIGENFDKNWAQESLQVLCKKRHVFLGQNLYSKGACFGMCRKMHVGKKLDDYLYRSEDLVEVNLSMQLQIRGKESKYILINAGQNWYDASHSMEVIIGSENQLSFMTKSMLGGEMDTYTITLNGLPQRADRTTRLRITAEYQDATHCKVTIKDLGFGELFPATNLVWTSMLDVE